MKFERLVSYIRAHGVKIYDFESVDKFEKSTAWDDSYFVVRVPVELHLPIQDWLTAKARQFVTLAIGQDEALLASANSQWEQFMPPGYRIADEYIRVRSSTEAKIDISKTLAEVIGDAEEKCVGYWAARIEDATISDSAEVSSKFDIDSIAFELGIEIKKFLQLLTKYSKKEGLSMPDYINACKFKYGIRK